MIIIGISGKKRSGKDTVANIVEQLLLDWKVPLEFKRMAFADSLYREVAWYVYFIRNGCEPPNEHQIQETVRFIKEHKDAFRLILQGWGTDYTRDLVCKTYWIDRVADKLSVVGNETFTVITDVRFENEFQLFLKHEYPMWRLLRDSDDDDAHVSEQELKKNDSRFSCVICNNGTVEELKLAVTKELKSLLTKKGFTVS